MSSRDPRARAFAAACCVALLPRAASAAEGPLARASLGGSHAVGAPQQSELGWGGHATLGVGYAFGDHFALSASASSYLLAPGAAPADPRFAARGVGFSVAGVAAARISFGGVWVECAGGGVRTASTTLPTVEASLGWSRALSSDGSVRLGPAAGWSHVFQRSDALRPEDANLVWVGAELSLETAPPRPVVKPPPPPPVDPPKPKDPEKPPPPPPDADRDTVPDAVDACPLVPGVPTADPKTNGCPSDRDHDDIVDSVDACPDVPGIVTTDPSTNGCPPTPMHMVGDHIVLDDVIHFGFGKTDVTESSRPLVKKIAEYLIARGDVAAVDIEGHADEVGSPAYNINLSRDRADAVRKLLVEYGVTATLRVHAWGKARPHAVGHDELTLRQNRRVEFIVSRKKDNGGPPPAPSEEAPHGQN